MRRKPSLVFVLAVVIVAALISSCELSISVERRLEIFLGDLNDDDRSEIYLNFHPTQTADYPAIRNGTKPDWDLVFPTGENYTYVGLNTADTDYVTGLIEGDMIIYSTVFVMAMDGMNWQIKQLSIDNGTTWLIQ